ncbi:MAG: hypothetical protein V3S14_07205 [Anaerolineae bacterium]
MKPKSHPQTVLLSSSDWKDYELLDSGDGRKLKRFGPYVLIRPEPRASWRPTLPTETWESAHAAFQPTSKDGSGHWQFHKPIDSPWIMRYKCLKFQAQVAAAQAGANVTHVDASKKAVKIARENQALSSREDHPIRWIVEDALKFVRREKRQSLGILPAIFYLMPGVPGDLERAPLVHCSHHLHQWNLADDPLSHYERDDDRIGRNHRHWGVGDERKKCWPSHTLCDLRSVGRFVADV